MQINTYKMIYLMILISLNIYMIKKLIQNLRKLPKIFSLEIIEYEPYTIDYYLFSYCKSIQLSYTIAWNLYDTLGNSITSICACNLQSKFNFKPIYNRQLIKCLHSLYKTKTQMKKLIEIFKFKNKNWKNKDLCTICKNNSYLYNGICYNCCVKNLD